MKITNNTTMLLTQAGLKLDVSGLMMLLFNGKTDETKRLYGNLNAAIQEAEHHLFEETLATVELTPVYIKLSSISDVADEVVYFAEVATIKEFFSQLPELIEPAIGKVNTLRLMDYFRRGIVLKDEPFQNMRIQLLVPELIEMRLSISGCCEFNQNVKTSV